MIQADFLIIGQGIAGTLLSYELINQGKKVLVIDKFNPTKSSLVAGAVLNPMSGKHWAPSPRAAVFIPKAIQTYRSIEEILNTSILTETRLNVFHESNEKRIQFEQQRKAFPSFFEEHVDLKNIFFKNDFGCGVINGLYQIHAEILLKQWRLYLESRNAFIEGEFEFGEIEFLPEEIRYRNISTSKIIFCIGAEAVSSPYFQCLPFTKNRGEALIVSIPDLPEDAIYHKHLRLIPKGNGLFWCGSNYIWNFENLKPDEIWKANAIKELKQWLQLPFSVKDHIVAQRPTTEGQVPIVGMHPQINNVAIFNGLGTRGFSSGPYWAYELAKQLLDPEYQIQKIN